MKSPRKFCIDANLIGCIQVLCKSAFNALFRIAIGKHIVLDVLCRLERLVNACRVFLCREDCAVIFTLNLVVGDMLHDHCCFLFVDKANDLGDKFFRVCFIHGKLQRRNPLNDLDNCSAGQYRTLGNFTNEVIGDMADIAPLQRGRAGFG